MIKCFGHFDNEDEQCAFCNVAVECYGNTDCKTKIVGAQLNIKYKASHLIRTGNHALTGSSPLPFRPDWHSEC